GRVAPPIVHPQRLADAAAERPQALPRLLRRNTRLLHDERRLEFAVATPQQFVGRVVIDAGEDADDAIRSRPQLGIAGPQVYHQVAETLAEPDHRTGRQHVEHELGGGPGLE